MLGRPDPLFFTKGRLRQTKLSSPVYPIKLMFTPLWWDIFHGTETERV